jgi:hypothetical protein
MYLILPYTSLGYIVDENGARSARRLKNNVNRPTSTGIFLKNDEESSVAIQVQCSTTFCLLFVGFYYNNNNVMYVMAIIIIIITIIIIIIIIANIIMIMK